MVIKQVSPVKILNWIGNGLKPSQNGYFEKRSPHDGSLLRKVSRSSGPEVDEAVAVAKKAQVAWAQTPAVKRGELLRKIASRLEENKALVASIVTAETGKSPSLAIGETEGAVSLGYFFAGEGQRLYGRTTTSSVVNRRSATVRQPIGVAGLFVPANTPIANVAWKVFPALICGNAAVVKASEDAPLTAWIFARIAYEAGLPGGVLSVVQGLGPEAGGALASHPDVGVLSFTGSTDVGKKILGFANERLARVSLELGGKNPFVVCDDADLERAADWAVLSAFSNAGQRCASASRLIIFKSVYNKFKTLILGKTKKLKVGPSDVDDLGPLISQSHLEKVAAAVERAKSEGARVLVGGYRLSGEKHRKGYYFAPTLIEGAGQGAEISNKELFGPVASMYAVKDLEAAIVLANDSAYGLTTAVHTRSLDRAHAFADRVRAGVVSINAATYGSEPHMPFGGFGASGNGTREPGTEALDVYSELKNILVNYRSEKVQ